MLLHAYFSTLGQFTYLFPMQGIAVMARMPGDADLGVVELEGEGGTLLRGKWSNDSHIFGTV